MAEGRPWRVRSVRARTTLLATVVSGTALVLGALLLVAAMDQSLRRSGDDLSRSRVQDLAGEAAAGTLPAVLPIGGEGVGQAFDESGRVLAASPNVSGRPAITAAVRNRAPMARVVDGAPDDNQTENYRVWVAAVPTADGTVTVLAGSSLESVQEATRTLRRDLLVAVPLLVLLVAAGTWLVVGRTLRPVEEIRAEVAAIGDDRLSGRRVPVPRTDDEVGRLAVTMNEMLDRLESAQRRQRAFVADASHELQSPITALRTELEVALQHPGEDWRALASRLLGDTEQMERLVRDLLFLARTTDGAAAASTTLVDLDDIVLEEVARVRLGTAVEVDTSGVSAAPVRGNADELRRLVRNLLENAVRHARTRVEVTLESGATTARLDVCDDGPGVPDEHRSHVFDRFWTADESRAAGSGSGLGLSIARAVAVRHGGSLDLAARNGTGAHFVLQVPSSDPRGRV